MKSSEGLLFSSSSLRDLLGGSTSKSTTNGKGKKRNILKSTKSDCDKIIETILLEETGRASKPQRKRKVLENAFAASPRHAYTQQLAQGTDVSKAGRLKWNNVNIFAAILGYSKGDISTLEKQFHSIKTIVDSVQRKLQRGYETIISRDDGLITIDDALMLLSYAEIQLDQDGFHRSVDASLVGDIIQTIPKIADDTLAEEGMQASPTNRESDLDASTEWGNTLLMYNKWLSFVCNCVRLQVMAEALLSVNQPQLDHAPTYDLFNTASMQLPDSRASTMQMPLFSLSLHPPTSGEGAFRPPVSRYGRSVELDSLMLTSISRESASQPMGMSIANTYVAQGAQNMKKRRKRDKSRELMSHGFDSSLGRPTPHCLTQSTSEPTSIDELRKELKLAQSSVAMLDYMLEENITWVQTNCKGATSLTGKTLSARAKTQCQRMALERIFDVLSNYYLNSLGKYLKRWSVNTKLKVMTVVAKQYAKTKGIELLTSALGDALLRNYRKMFIPWMRRMRVERRWEQEAASVIMQCMVRKKLASVRVHQVRIAKNVLIIQCAMRSARARHRVKTLLAERRLALTVTALQRWMWGHVLRKKAVAKVMDMRRNICARKIQKVARGGFARTRVAKLRALNEKKRVAAINIQRIVRGRQGRKRFARIKKQLLLEKRRRAEELAKKKAEEEEVKKRKEKKAGVVSNFFKRHVSTKNDRENLKKMKKEKEEEVKKQKGATGLQSLFRKRKASVHVAELKQKREQEMLSNSSRANSQEQLEDGESIVSASSSSVKKPKNTDDAALKLQSLARGRAARRKSVELKEVKTKNRMRLFGGNKKDDETKREATPPKRGFLGRLTTSFDGGQHDRVVTPPKVSDRSPSLPPDAPQSSPKTKVPALDNIPAPGTASRPASSASARSNAPISSRISQFFSRTADKEEKEDTQHTVGGAIEEIDESLDEGSAKLITNSRPPSASPQVTQRQRDEKSEHGDGSVRSGSRPSSARPPSASSNRPSSAASRPTSAASRPASRPTSAAQSRPHSATPHPPPLEAVPSGIAEEEGSIASVHSSRSLSGKHISPQPSIREDDAPVSRAASSERPLSSKLPTPIPSAPPSRAQSRERTAPADIMEATEEQPSAERLSPEMQDDLVLAEELQKIMSHREDEEEIEPPPRPLSTGSHKSDGGGLVRQMSAKLGSMLSGIRPSTSTPNLASMDNEESDVINVRPTRSASSIFGNLKTPDFSRPATAASEGAPTPLAKMGSMFSSSMRSLGRSISSAAQSLSRPETPADRSSTPQRPPIVKRFSSDTITKDDAAWHIQQAVRSRQAWKRVSKRREEVKLQQQIAGAYVIWAVVTVQRVMRGKLGRLRFAAKKEAHDRFLEEVNATKIQALMRGKSVRSKSQEFAAEAARRRAEDEEDVQFAKWGMYENLEENRGKASPLKPLAVDVEPSPDKISPVKSLAKSPTKSPAKSSVPVPSDDPAVNELDERIRRLEAMEKSIMEKEQKMMEAAKLAAEKAEAMEKTLKALEERARVEEAEKFARQRLMDMAAGPVSHRSPYNSIGPKSSRTPRTGRMLPSAPPSARSAKDGTPRPDDAARLIHGGKEWIQLWDGEMQAYYWYCEKTGEAQWEQPGLPAESSGGYMTDYSTDYYSSGGEYDQASQNPSGWQEYWDEQAQAKYWYNYNTGEASWTPPDAFASNSTVVSSRAAMTEEWVSYIDDATGQEYWYNSITGETSWA